MDFVRINGWTVEIAEGAADFESTWLDADFKSELGKQVLRKRKRRTEWSFSTVPLTAAEAETVEGLIAGLGHVWSFESVTLFQFSSRGRAPINASAFLTRVTTFPRFGTACGFLNGSVSWDLSKGIAPLLDRWTVSMWRNIANSATTWEHFVVRSDGAVWKDGVRDDTITTPWLSVFNGFLTLNDSAVRIDDLVVLCFAAADDAIAAWYAYGVDEKVGFSNLPELHVDGAFIEGEDVFVVGAMRSSSLVTFQQDGEWQNAGRVVDFRLTVRKDNPRANATPVVHMSFDVSDGDPPRIASGQLWVNVGAVVIGGDGQVEGCGTFDGANYIQANNNANLSFTITTLFAMAMWVKPTTTATMAIASKVATGTAGWLWFLRPVTGGFEVVFRMQDSTNTTFREISGGLVCLDEWHHVGIIHTAATGKFDLVVDGEIVNDVVRTNTLVTSVANSLVARIGNSAIAGLGFVGSIDEFYHWSATATTPTPVTLIEAAYDANRNRRRLPVRA